MVSARTLAFPCHTWAMRNGIIGGICAAVLVLACSLVVNAYQIWGVYSVDSYRLDGGFPLTCYYRHGIIGIASFNSKHAIYNGLIAIGAATLAALSVFVLFNTRAIMRRIVLWIRR